MAGHRLREALRRRQLDVVTLEIALDRPAAVGERSASSTSTSTTGTARATSSASSATTGSNTTRPPRAGTVPTKAERFLAAIPNILGRFAGGDLLLYQAGADPHVDDPLGGWLDTVQLRERDRRVFAACKARGLAVAWNLAGGYQASLRHVLDIHDNNMMRECLSAFAGVDRSGA